MNREEAEALTDEELWVKVAEKLHRGKRVELRLCIRAFLMMED